MAAVTSFKSLRGLDTNSNPLVGTPGKDAGGSARSAVTIADNVSLSRQRMLSNRRGFAYFTKTTPATVVRMFEFQTYLVEHQADDKLYRSTHDVGTRTAYSGTYTPPAGYRMAAAVCR